MRLRLVRFFCLTWFSFAFFYCTMMPLIDERTMRELLRPALVAGFFVAVASSLFEWMRLRHKVRSGIIS